MRSKLRIWVQSCTADGSFRKQVEMPGHVTCIVVYEETTLTLKSGCQNFCGVLLGRFCFRVVSINLTSTLKGICRVKSFQGGVCRCFTTTLPLVYHFHNRWKMFRDGHAKGMNKTWMFEVFGSQEKKIDMI